ncbi:hypothetical protein [Chitinophaga sancti]|uniref:Uncharacterized protein n=1 Tax=Chitinophaga sancti TaxID=1004 RepID=A0A1K1SYD2_9BACT|nr:hypothetical protein [Chitinophaga sancti]WQD63937.1 hypothetical protein U0033_05975 [Chitinophaga sancti]WQG90438.1 hypothetical protein SR876_02945 [Chitinophaga sancti]SFW89385.1 hypothetical protein SAMN05661012_06422 [Chitinophaga sancti]
MFFQKFLKGINELKDEEAKAFLLDGHGIVSNWWRAKHTINNQEIQDQLTEKNMIHHLNNYDTPLPANHPYASLGKTYGHVTPYISTTAGSVQRDDFYQTNIVFPALTTALRFATDNFRSEGYIFYGYLITIQKKSIELVQFSEEVRELHIYPRYLPYHHEGELMAKIHIPAVQLEKAEKYNGPAALKELRQSKLPSAVDIINNPKYVDPLTYTNIKELI